VAALEMRQVPHAGDGRDGFSRRGDELPFFLAAQTAMNVGPAAERRHSMAWHSTAWHGTAWHSTAWHGTAWHGTLGSRLPPSPRRAGLCLRQRMAKPRGERPAGAHRPRNRISRQVPIARRLPRAGGSARNSHHRRFMGEFR